MEIAQVKFDRFGQLPLHLLRRLGGCAAPGKIREIGPIGTVLRTLDHIDL